MRIHFSPFRRKDKLRNADSGAIRQQLSNRRSELSAREQHLDREKALLERDLSNAGGAPDRVARLQQALRNREGERLAVASLLAELEDISSALNRSEIGALTPNPSLARDLAARLDRLDDRIGEMRSSTAILRESFAASESGATQHLEDVAEQ